MENTRYKYTRKYHKRFGFLLRPSRGNRWRNQAPAVGCQTLVHQSR